MLKIELLKLWKKRSFLVFISFILITNLFTLGYSQNMDQNHLSQAYNKLQSTLSQIPNDQRYSYIQNYYQTIKAFEAIEQLSALMVDPQGNAYLIEELQTQYPDLDQYQEQYQQNINYYSGQLESEIVFIEDVYKEMTTLYQYPAFIDNILKQAETTQDISIFQTQKSNEQCLHEKSYQDYQQCQDIVITFDLQKGITDALSFPLSHFLTIIVLVMIVSSLIIDEKEKGLLAFMKTTKKGYIPTILCKIITMMISMAIIMFVMTVSQLIYMQLTCGLGDLSRSLQSLANYQQCPWHLSVLEFIGYVLIIRWLVICCIGMILLWLAVWMKNRYLYFMSILMVFILEFVCYIFIDPLSNVYLLKYMNIIFLLQGHTLFQVHRYVSLFGQSMSLQSLLMICVIAVMIIFAIAFHFTYQHQEDLSLHEYQNILKRKHVSLSLGKQEAFKIVWLQKGIIFILVCLLFSCFEMKHIHIYPSYEEKVYMQYMQKLEGPLTDEKEQWILEEEKRYQDIHQEYDAIVQKYNNHEISEHDSIMLLNTLDSQLEGEATFLKIYETYQLMKEDTCIEFVTPYFYQSLLQSSWLLLPSLLLLILTILCLSHVFSYEYIGQTHCFIQISPLQKKVKSLKLKISFIMIIILFVCMFIPLFIPYMKTYGLSNLHASIRSLGYVHLPSLPIGFYLLIHFLIQLFALICAVLVMYVFQVYFKNQFVSLLVTIFIFVCPLLISYGGFPLFDHLSLYPLLMNGIFIEQLPQLVFSIVGYGMIILIAYFLLKQKI